MHSSPRQLRRQAPARRPRHRTTPHPRGFARHRRPMRLRTRIVLIAIALIAASLLWAIAARAFAPTGNTTAARFNAIIVLGARIDRDGNPGPVLLSRLTEGVREYERGVAPKLIVSGGEQHGHIQADIMARVLQAQGVPASAIVLEPNAGNTIENACYSTRIMKQRGWQSAEVVTSASHLPRAAIIFHKLPIAWRAHAAPSLSPSDAGGSSDEVLHTMYYLLFSQWHDRCSP